MLAQSGSQQEGDGGVGEARRRRRRRAQRRRRRKRLDGALVPSGVEASEASAQPGLGDGLAGMPPSGASAEAGGEATKRLTIL